MVPGAGAGSRLRFFHSQSRVCQTRRHQHRQVHLLKGLCSSDGGPSPKPLRFPPSPVLPPLFLLTVLIEPLSTPTLGGSKLPPVPPLSYPNVPVLTFCFIHTMNNTFCQVLAHKIVGILADAGKEHRRPTSIRLTAEQEQDAHTISFSTRPAVSKASGEESAKRRPTWQLLLKSMTTHSQKTEHTVGSWQPHMELRGDDS